MRRFLIPLGMLGMLWGMSLVWATDEAKPATSDRPGMKFPRSPSEPRWTPALMMQVKRIASVQVSPDGQLGAYTVRQAVMEGDKSEYLTHIYLAQANGNQSWQLTQGDKSCDDPQWSPDGQWLAFVSSRSGKKNLWVIRPRGGEAGQLTDVTTGVATYKWSPDGRWLAFTAKDPPSPQEEKASREKNDARVMDQNIKMYRLHVVPFAAPPKLQREARLLSPGSYSIGGDGRRVVRPAFDWSPDSKTIVFSHTRTPSYDDWTSADLSLVDVASGTVKPFLHTAAAEHSPFYSPDGKWIAYVSSDSPPHWAWRGRVHVIPAAGGSPKVLADTWDNFGGYSELLGWSADSRKLYFTEFHGTVLKVLALPLEGSPVELSRAAGMAPGGVSLNVRRTRFGMGWETSSQPPEAHITAVEPFAPVPISREHGDLAKVPLGSTEVIHWKSTDGRDIEGLLTYPAGYEKGKRYPLVLMIHGGPESIFSQIFTATPGAYPVAAFAARGYAVLRPNPRGSSGYGQLFRLANFSDWGGGDYRDIMSGVDRVVALGIADPDRMGVMGWSYGGFMTSWVITQTKRFRAASVGAGLSNLVSFTGTSDIPSYLPSYFGGEFWDKDRLAVYGARSPLFQVRGVATPTLILHGERDERVPLSQGQELYNALKRQGCITKMVIYPRTPHAIEEPRLLLDCMNRNLEWINRYVRDP